MLDAETDVHPQREEAAARDQEDETFIVGALQAACCKLHDDDLLTWVRISYPQESEMMTYPLQRIQSVLL